MAGSGRTRLPRKCVLLVGDYGGQIYLAFPARDVHCDEPTLRVLLRDLDVLAWPCNDPDGASIAFVRRRVGSSVAGGMGGGVIAEGGWVHREFVDLGLEPEVREVLSGVRHRLSDAARADAQNRVDLEEMWGGAAGLAIPVRVTWMVDAGKGSSRVLYNLGSHEATNVRIDAHPAIRGWVDRQSMMSGSSVPFFVVELPGFAEPTEIVVRCTQDEVGTAVAMGPWAPEEYR